MDIERWLRHLGLQQYVATFRDNAIDREVLTELTETDLEKLGIVLAHNVDSLFELITLPLRHDFTASRACWPPRIGRI